METADAAGHEYGWDNEHPKREVHVNSFRIEWRPVSNGEFHDFYTGTGKGLVNFPASWVEVEGEIQVGHNNSVFGITPNEIAGANPLWASSLEDRTALAVDHLLR